MSHQLKILFVCLGNICRSPALEATLKKILKERGKEAEIVVESCGLSDSFLGAEADHRICAEAEHYEINIDTRSKLFQRSDFDKFDHIFVVDKEIETFLKSQAVEPVLRNKVQLATKYSRRFPNQEIPDPFGRGSSSFAHVMEIVWDACLGIADHLLSKETR